MATRENLFMRAIGIVAIVGFIVVASCSPALAPPTSIVPSEVAPSAEAAGSWVEVDGVHVRADDPRAVGTKTGQTLVVEIESVCPPETAGAAYVYDPAKGVLENVPEPPQLGGGLAMTAMADGRVLIAGGFDARFEPSTQSYLWDPSGGTWAEGPRLRNRRHHGVMATLSDGRILLTGGDTLSPEPPGDMSIGTNATDIYDPSAGVWTTTSPLPNGFQEPSAVALASGQVLVVPDWFANQEIPSSALYDSATGTWSLMAAPPDFPEPLDALVALPDGTALAIDSAGAVARFDTASGWRRAGVLLAGRFDAAVAVLKDGRVLVAGGVSDLLDVVPPAVPALRTAELFDPDTGRSSSLADMPNARISDIAVALDDGSVLVVGGREVTESEIDATPVPDDPGATPPPDDADPNPEPTPRCPPDSFPALRWVP